MEGSGLPIFWGVSDLGFRLWSLATFWAHGRVPEIERPLLRSPHNLILSIPHLRICQQ